MGEALASFAETPALERPDDEGHGGPVPCQGRVRRVVVELIGAEPVEDKILAHSAFGDHRLVRNRTWSGA